MIAISNYSNIYIKNKEKIIKNTPVRAPGF